MLKDWLTAGFFDINIDFEFSCKSNIFSSYQVKKWYMLLKIDIPHSFKYLAKVKVLFFYSGSS